MYRPQFPMPKAPDGWAWQPCVYQFDTTNTPAFSGLILNPGQETGHIPLKIDKDSCFVLLAVRVFNFPANVLLFDPWTNQLMDDYVRPSLYASDEVMYTVLEGPGIEVPAGSTFAVRLQGQ
jgi:hypothetical protein